jgi:hypothetical protein
VYNFINAGIPDWHPDQSGTGMDKNVDVRNSLLPDKEDSVWFWNAPVLRMPMPTASASMPMPSYGYRVLPLFCTFPPNVSEFLLAI